MKRAMQVTLLLAMLAMPAGAGEMVPYSMSLQSGPTDFQVYPPTASQTLENCGAGPFLYVEITAVGTVTHIGHVTDFQRHCVNLADNTFFNGEFVFTGDNGDTLLGTYHGSLEFIQTGMLIHGEVELVGGTGRFKGAIGSGNAEGVQYMNEEGIVTGSTLTGTGVISSVGSSHR